MRAFILAGTSVLTLLAAPAINAAPIIFNYTGGFVTYTIPVAGTYDIVAYGAQGGISDTRGSGSYGGAEIGGDVLLTLGEVLSIAVGGQGGNAVVGSSGGGGGGGGSFVIAPGTVPLMIAGGGGGGSAFGGSGGQTGTTGGTGNDGLPNDGFGIAGGSNGAGGGSSLGGGGGGLISAGAGNSSLLGAGGSSYGGGLAGGTSGTAGSGGTTSIGSMGGSGGFGGGGGGASFGIAAGGGGGYSGGGGAFSLGGGGGGGSFDTGLSNADLIKVANENFGNGLVTISLVSTTSTAVPEPASLGLLGVGLLGTLITVRRRRGRRLDPAAPQLTPVAPG